MKLSRSAQRLARMKAGDDRTAAPRIVGRKAPRSCGYLHLLLDRIESGLEGNSAASAASYIAIWLPIARRLKEVWLPAFDDETRSAALKLSFASLPEIE